MQTPYCYYIHALFDEGGRSWPSHIYCTNEVDADEHYEMLKRSGRYRQVAEVQPLSFDEYLEKRFKTKSVADPM